MRRGVPHECDLPNVILARIWAIDDDTARRMRKAAGGPAPKWSQRTLRLGDADGEDGAAFRAAVKAEEKRAAAAGRGGHARVSDADVRFGLRDRARAAGWPWLRVRPGEEVGPGERASRQFAPYTAAEAVRAAIRSLDGGTRGHAE